MAPATQLPSQIYMMPFSLINHLTKQHEAFFSDTPFHQRVHEQNNICQVLTNQMSNFYDIKIFHLILCQNFHFILDVRNKGFFF